MIAVNMWHWKSCIRKSVGAEMFLITSKNNFHSITLFALSLNTQHMCDRFATCDFALFTECCLRAHWMCWVYKAMEKRVGVGHDANVWQTCRIDVREMGPLRDQGIQHRGRWLEKVALGCLDFPLCVAEGCKAEQTGRCQGLCSVPPPPQPPSRHTHTMSHKRWGGDRELCVYTNRSVTMANHAKPDSHDVTWATWGEINNKSSCS